MIKIIDQLLNYETTIEEATEKLESMYIPIDTASGYAMSKYKDSILSALESKKLDRLEQLRKTLDEYNAHKEDDTYYKAFQNQFRNNENFRDYDSFISDFNKFLSALPEYTVTQLNDVKLDFDSTCHTYIIQSSVLNDSFRLRTDTDKDNKITWVHFSTERKTYGNLQFALLASYVYSSMGFEIEDYDEFYEKYNLFSTEKIFESELVDDYEIYCMTIDTTNEISFSITAI